MGQKKDLTGLRFGRLVAIRETKERSSDGNVMWLCRCDCGKEKTIKSGSLISGVTVSCGCYHTDRVSKENPKYKRRLYRKYWSMRNRCEYEGAKYYHCYGGRGIKVCDEWKDFETFEKWAYQNGYEEGLTLDRIDNNGDYSPNNCRWITIKEQQNNKRTNVYKTINGQRKTVQQWSEETGIHRNTIYRRIALGWKDEDLINPVDKSRSHGDLIKQYYTRKKENDL